MIINSFSTYQPVHNKTNLAFVKGNHIVEVSKLLKNEAKVSLPNLIANYTPNIVLRKPRFLRRYHLDFLLEYKDKYGDIPLEETLKKIVETEQPIGAGKDKRCYIFPGMEDYIIAHLYRYPLDNKSPKILPSDLKFPMYNFGEPIMSNGESFMIMKRILGKQNLMDYIPVVKSLIANGRISKDVALEYLEKLKPLADFPQSAYDKLAQQIKYLNENGQCFDFINPNNILVDFTNQEFHMLDLFDIKDNNSIRSALDINKERQFGAWEMSFSLLSLLHCYFLDAMDDDTYNETVKNASKIIQKCFIAAKNANLSTSDDIARSFYKCRAKSPKLAFPRLDEFFNLYEKYTNID